MTAKRLRDLADRADASARELADLGHLELANRASALANELRAEAALLTAGKRSPKVDEPEMTDEHREAISRAHGGDSAPMRAARLVGVHSQAQLAKLLGVSGSFLSQVIAGTKQMPPDRAEAFEKLTGKRWKI